MLEFALNAAVKTDIVMTILWVIAFPALVTGLIVFAIAIARGEGQENREHRRYPPV